MGTPERKVSKPNGRKGNIKVRSGCKTCKIRKIKCSEEKPHCQRCTSTGRKCDGYSTLEEQTKPRQNKQRNRSSNQPLNQPPLLTISSPFRWRSNHERRAFDQFLAVAAPALGGRTGAQFFAYVIPQVCYQDRAVHAATLAISASHELWLARATPRHQIANAESLLKFSLEHYNESIQLLAKYIGQTVKYEIVLLVCLLFVALEFLQDDFYSANQHVQQGLSILTSPSGMEAVKNSILIPAYLTPMIWRTLQISFMFGDVPRIVSWSEATLSSENNILVLFDSKVKDVILFFQSLDRFESLAEARFGLVQVLNRVLELIWLDDQTTQGSKFAVPIDDLRVHQRALSSCLERWFPLFSKFRVKIANDLGTSGPHILATHLLHIHHLIATIWASTTLFHSEMAYDYHEKSFAVVIGLAEVLIASQPVTLGGDVDHPFALEWNVIAPLYFVATKCRVDHIRQKALSLMDLATAKQQTRRARLMLQVAHRVAALETGIPTASLGLGEYSIYIPEENRIAKININHARPDSRGRSKHVASFFRKSSRGTGIEYVEAFQETFMI